MVDYFNGILKEGRRTIFFFLEYPIKQLKNRETMENRDNGVPVFDGLKKRSASAEENNKT